MLLTSALVDTVVPEHGRTSCSDDNLANAYGGWNGKYNPNTGEKIIHFPRCNRCYLLANLGKDLADLPFQLELSLTKR